MISKALAKTICRRNTFNVYVVRADVQNIVGLIMCIHYGVTVIMSYYVCNVLFKTLWN